MKGMSSTSASICVLNPPNHLLLILGIYVCVRYVEVVQIDGYIVCTSVLYLPRSSANLHMISKHVTTYSRTHSEARQD